MARIQTTAIISSINGSISGTTFQNSVSGLIARRKPNPYNKNSVIQSEKKNIMFYLQNSWIGLPLVQKEKWKMFAKFVNIAQKNNPNKILNGHQLFIQCNINLYSGNKSFVFTPPQKDYNLENIDFTPLPIGGDICIVADRTINEAKEFILFMASFPQSMGVLRTNVNMKLIGLTDFVNDDTYNISSGYIAVFGMYPYIYYNIIYKYKVVNLINGIGSPWQFGKFINS
jgi:hypothetical protein